jgi:hypothetical protein
MSELASDILHALLDTCELDVEDKITFFGVLDNNHVMSRDSELAHRALRSVSS